MCRQLPKDWLDRTLIRSWLGTEDGVTYRFEVRQDPVSGLKVKARMPAPRAPSYQPPPLDREHERP